MIPRSEELRRLTDLLWRFPVVCIVGARQVGKTTLARNLAAKWEGQKSFFDLENLEDLSRLTDPMLALKELRGLIVIDEIQGIPNLFPVLRVLADRPRKPARFLILGSAAPHLLKQGAETLAGRIIYHELGGLKLEEVGMAHHAKLWFRGGFPLSYLASSERASHEWRRAFIRTFLERDLRQLGIGIPPSTLQRFWTMLAHAQGQVWNASEFGRSFGVADTTVRRYLDALCDALVVRQLPPWHVNISKRQVKSPKIYLRDSGILHALLNLQSVRELEGHYKVGGSWEGFGLEQTIARLRAETHECFFWATHAGAELDLLVTRGKRRLGFEFKRTSSPRLTPSMRTAIRDLGLTGLSVVHAGTESFGMAPKVRAIALSDLQKEVHPL